MFSCISTDIRPEIKVRLKQINYCNQVLEIKMNLKRRYVVACSSSLVPSYQPIDTGPLVIQTLISTLVILQHVLAQQSVIAQPPPPPQLPPPQPKLNQVPIGQSMAPIAPKPAAPFPGVSVPQTMPMLGPPAPGTDESEYKHPRIFHLLVSRNIFEPNLLLTIPALTWLHNFQQFAAST